MADKNPWAPSEEERNPFAPPPATVPQRIADVGLSVGKGVVGLGEAAVGIADIYSGGRAGNWLEQNLGYQPTATKRAIDELMSPAGREDARAVGEAKGFFPTIAEAASRPWHVGNVIGESAPAMAAGIAMGRGMQRAAPGMPAWAAAGAGEGIVSAGSTAESIRQETGTLDTKGTLAALGAGGAVAATGGIGALASRYLKAGDPDTWGLLNKGLAKVEGSMLTRVPKSAAVEGLEEVVQSGAEKGFENVGTGKPVMEGVPESAAIGGVAGFALGGVSGIARPQQNDPQAKAPPGPLQAAAAVGQGAAGVTGQQGAGEPAKPQYGGIRGEIASAAQRHGVDPLTALTIASIETGGRFNADAKNPRSSAEGAFQFMQATRRMFPEVTPEQWKDPKVQAEYGARFIAQTNARLAQGLGRAPTTGEAYMGHLLGSFGAQSLLTADPNTPVQDVIAAYDPKRAAEIVRLNGMKGLTAGQAIEKWNGIAQRHQERLGVEQAAFPFADKAAAEMRVRAASREGQMLEVVEHPNVPGRFAALPPMEGDPNEEQPASKVPLIADLPRYDEDPRQATQAVQATPQGQEQAPAVAAGLPAAAPGDAQPAQAGPGAVPPAAVASADVPEVPSQPATAPVSGAQLGGGAPQANQASGVAVPGQPANDALAGAAPQAEPVVETPTPEEQAALQEELRAEMVAKRGLTPGVDYNGDPTPGQAEAGNYKKVHERWGGLALTIENPVGSTRRSKDPANPWEVTMEADYGYIKRTKGGDEEHIDFYRPLDAAEDAPVWVIDQNDPATGTFDEHKVVLGVNSREEAELIYDTHFADGSGPQRRYAITEMSLPEFKSWIKGDTDTAMPGVMAKTAVQEEMAVKAGVLPPAAADEPAGGLFAGLPQAAKYAADNGLDATPVAAEGGFALAPNVRPQQLDENDLGRLASLDSAVQRLGFGPVAPLRSEPRPEAALAASVAQRAFGVKVVHVEDNPAFAGVAYKDRIYLTSSEKHPTLAVAGHEITHAFEGTPLHTKLVEVFKAYGIDPARQVSLRQGEEQAGEKVRKITRTYARNEIVADLNGSMWIDPKFWSEMIAKDENLFRQVAYKFMELATKAVQVVKGSKFDAATIVNDVTAARSAIAQAWADHVKAKAPMGKAARNADPRRAPITFMDDEGNERRPRNIEETAKAIRQNVNAAVEYGKALAKNHDFDHNVGDQLYSKKTGKTYKITSRGFQRTGKVSENKWEAVYYYERGTEGEEGWERGTFIESRMRETGSLINLTTPRMSKTGDNATSQEQPDGNRSTQTAAAPAAQGLQVEGGARGGREPVSVYGRPERGAAPLAGLPRIVQVDGKSVTFGPFQPAHDAAASYMKRMGMKYEPPTTYAKVNPQRARRIAQAFADMKHNPQDPVVKQAYAAMIRQTVLQYEAMLATGLQVEFIDTSKPDPYGNPRNAILDVVNNNHLWVYPTDDGFGSDADFDASDNPLLEFTNHTISGKRARANDLFRAVHDYFGHIKDGVGFRADGEENAWRSHSAMYSPLARMAMTTETRGQNSWLNFGPHGEANRKAKTADTVFADQKIGILPSWVINEGRTDDGVELPKFSKSSRRLATTDPDWQTDVIFHSALHKELDKAVSAKALPVIGWKQALTSLTNKGLVKKDEITWTGIDEWLDAKSTAPPGQGELFEVPKIPKADVMKFIAANGVRVTEVELSGPDESEKASWISERADEIREEREEEWERYRQRQAENFDSGYYVTEIDDPDEIRRFIDDGQVDGLTSEDDAPEKLWGVFAEGSRRYPEGVYETEDEAYERETELRDSEWEDYEDRLRDDFFEGSDPEGQAEEEWDQNEGEGDDKFRNYSLPGGDNYRELLLTLASPNEDGKYTSSHWDEKGVIAHTRLKDRFEDRAGSGWTGGGDKVLFVEEIQSDWAQEGREEGFRRENTPEEQAKIDALNDVYVQRRDRVDALTNQLEMTRDIEREVRRKLVETERIDPDNPEASETTFDALVVRQKELEAKMQKLMEQRVEAIEARKEVERELSELNKAAHGTPRAPFVDKTDKWVELVLKRIIRMAAEGGYDKVAFATGQQNADRYDLQQEVDRIEYAAARPDENGNLRWHVAVYGSGYGQRLIVNDYFDEKGLKATLGADLTAKIVEDKGAPKVEGASEGQYDAVTSRKVLKEADLKMGGEGMLKFYDEIVPNLLKKMLPKLGGDKQLQTIKLRYPEGNRDGSRGRPVDHEHIAFPISPKMRETVLGGTMPLFLKTGVVPAVTMPDIKGAVGGKWTDLRPLNLAVIGGRQLAEVYAKDLPQLPQYQKLVQLMQAGVNDYAAKADDVARDWGKVKDADALANLMHDSTLAQLDPSKPYVPGDPESTYRELTDRWNKLSPEAKAIYTKARDMYEGHYAEVRQAIRDRIERAEGLSTPRRAEMLSRMDGEFFSRIKGVYFPLARFGDYIVVVRDEAGKVASVSRAETKHEADALRRELKSDFGAGYTVSAVIRSAEFNAKRDAVGSEFLEKLFSVLDQTGLGEDLQDDINQLVLSSMPDLSWAKHGIHRKGTAGFSNNARRAFAQNMFHGARYLQRVRFGDRLERQLREAEKYVKGRAELTESVKAQQVLNEVRKRHDLLMNPSTHPWSQALTSFGFFFHLGLSPATALVNLSQTPLVAFPILSGKFGFGRSGAALTKASADVMASKNDLTKALKGDELKAVKQAIAEGTIDVTLAHDLAGIAQGNDSALSWKLRPVMRAASWMFHHAERFNRGATFLAAYRLARESGQDFDAAVTTATELTYDSHFDYASSNRPRAMQGDVAKVVTQFKQYVQNMLFTLGNNTRKAIRGDKQAMKTLAGMTVMHAMAAGALGMNPLVGPLLSLASMLGSDDDEPWDARVALQNYLADTFGQKPAEVMMHGVSRLGPADISGRVSLDGYRMLFPDVNEALTGADAYAAFVTGMLGPVIGGVGGGLAKAYLHLQDGDVTRALESMLPSVARNPVKAMRFAQEGARTKEGLPIKDEVSAAGIVSQAIGFRPSEVANAQEGRGAILTLDRRLNERRANLMEDFAKAAIKGEDTAAAALAIQKWNESNPTRVIGNMHLKASITRRVQRAAQAEQGVVLRPNNRDALDAGRFALENR